jgi:hypothetical protein
MDCNDEKIKNWKSDVFCCRSMEFNYREGHIDPSVAWPDRKASMLIKTVSFYNEEAEIKQHLQDIKNGFGKCSGIEFCPWCGFKLTDEFIRKIVNKYNSINKK